MELIPYVKTAHVTKFAWHSWKECGDVPDLSPGSIQSNLLLTIRDATEMAAGEVIGPVARKAEVSGAAYDGPKCLDDIFHAAFWNLDSSAMKALKKVFDTVMKSYYTVIFMDPTGANKEFMAYASPGMYYDLEQLVKEQAPLEAEEQLNELQAKIAKLKGNACRFARGHYLCGQPVSGRVACSHWAPPEEGNKFQCYYQDRNPEQVSIEDAFWCLCEAAWEEANPEATQNTP